MNNKLLDFFKENGISTQISGNTPFLLRDMNKIYFIETGSVDIFRVNIRDGNQKGARHYFATLNKNELFIGLDDVDTIFDINFLAAGTVNTTIIGVSRKFFFESLYNGKIGEEVIPAIESWINKLSEGTVRPVYPIPRADHIILEETELSFDKAKRFKLRNGLSWIHKSNATALYAGMEELEFKEDSHPFPLSSFAWFDSIGKSDYRFVTTKTIIENKLLAEGLESFYEAMFGCEMLNRSLINADDLVRLNLKAEHQVKKEEKAFKDLTQVMESHKEIKDEDIEETNDPLLKACYYIGKELDVTIIPPTAEQKKYSKSTPVSLIADNSGIRVREIRFKGDWYKFDNGPLLAVLKENQNPVVLVRKKNGYNILDPDTNELTQLTKEKRTELEEIGFMFYKSFNPSEKINLKKLFTIGIKDIRFDILRVLIIAIVTSILGLLTPIFTSIIYDSVIPSYDRSNLYSLIVILISVALVSGIFQIAQAITRKRIDTKLDYQLQAAIWDRLLNLPVKFFKKFSSGDLAVRTMGIAILRKSISETFLGTITSIVFAISNFVLLFYYSTDLAVWAFVPLLISISITAFIGYSKYKIQKVIQSLIQNIQSILLQIISGISKLRVSATENSAFALWANLFTKQRRLEFKSRLFDSYLLIFNAAFPLLTSILFFIIVINKIDSSSLSTGNFIAFNTAFAAFLGAMTQISTAALTILQLEPTYSNAKPIMDELPEVTKGKTPVGELSGGIEMNHITFRYNENSPLILKDVSIKINPGEFVAVVGPSGSGKSTLLRILMGFENPESGSVFYDGQDLSKIDVKEVRRQIGIVIQNGKLLSGSILQNIIGSSQLSIEEAWEAARLSGFDQDLRQMPMQMHTMVSEGGSTLSGGQRQRLMIAKAIVRKPKIIMMDEATSALDNRTQEIVSNSLDRLQATRLVIAHRLSTIINADRIIVMKDGEIIQEGSYKELVEQEGMFKELAERQIA